MMSVGKQPAELLTASLSVFSDLDGAVVLSVDQQSALLTVFVATVAASDIETVMAAWSLVKRLAGNTASSVAKAAEAAKRLTASENTREVALAILGHAAKHAETLEDLERLQLPGALCEVAEAYAMLGKSAEARVLANRAWDIVKDTRRRKSRRERTIGTHWSGYFSPKRTLRSRWGRSGIC